MTTPTVSNIFCGDNFEFLLDIRVEKAVKIKSVRAFLPTSQVRYLVSMNNVAFGSKLVYVGHFGINSCEKQARIGNWTICYVGGTIVPRQANAIVENVFLVPDFWTALGLEELHYTGNRIRGSLSDSPGWRNI